MRPMSSCKTVENIKYAHMSRIQTGLSFDIPLTTGVQRKTK